MTTVVVSQPMVLPWIGILGQVALADVFVHYDDVQLPQGRSFSTRVQLKTAEGRRWLTVPVDRGASGRLISETVAVRGGWREKHLKTLRHALGGRPERDAALALAERIYANEDDNLAHFNAEALEDMARFANLSATRFLRSSELGIEGSGSERLLEICRALGAKTYVTGHGARNYLRHGLFEDAGIAVRYMDYEVRPWPQPYGDFTPFVTSLDLFASVPKAQIRPHLPMKTRPWRDFSGDP